ncbi:hypothetical protein ACOME3_003557 [Neoechinorhynchus agilis]
MAIPVAYIRAARSSLLTIMHIHILVSLVITFLFVDDSAEFRQSTHLDQQLAAHKNILKFLHLPMILVIVLSSIKTGILVKHWKFQKFQIIGIFALQFSIAVASAVVIYNEQGIMPCVAVATITVPTSSWRLMIEFCEHKLHEERHGMEQPRFGIPLVVRRADNCNGHAVQIH